MTTKTAQVRSVEVTEGGSGYIAGATDVTFTGGDGSGVVGVVTVTGEITDITVTEAGTGYEVGDPIMINGDGEDAEAEVATVDTGGEILTVTITDPGAGYTWAEAVFDGAGEGAEGTVEITGEVTGVEITDGGAGYTEAPTVGFTGDGTGAAGISTIAFAWERQFKFLTQPRAGREVPGAVDGYTADDGKPAGAQHVGWVHGVATGSGPITSATITEAGSGYTEATVIIDGDGAGARATAVIDGGAIDEIIIESGGAGYTTATITIEGQDDFAGTEALATAVITERVKKETISAFGSMVD